MFAIVCSRNSLKLLTQAEWLVTKSSNGLDSVTFVCKSWLLCYWFNWSSFRVSDVIIKSEYIDKVSKNLCLSNLILNPNTYSLKKFMNSVVMFCNSRACNNNIVTVSRTPVKPFIILLMTSCKIAGGTLMTNWKRLYLYFLQGCKYFRWFVDFNLQINFG